jgi:hypothetical protein
MNAEKRNKGQPRKVPALNPETAVALAGAVQELREIASENADVLLRLCEATRRACHGFDPNLALLVSLRRHYNEKKPQGWMLPWVMGWGDLSPLEDWIERSFSRVAVLAFNARDTGFSNQLLHLQECLENPRITVSDMIVRAYEVLAAVLGSPPAEPGNFDTHSEQVAAMILTEPYGRAPSNGEIRSYLEWFEGLTVNREQVKNEAGFHGWKLSDSRKFPVSSDENGVANSTGDWCDSDGFGG